MSISDTAGPVRCAHGLVVTPGSPWVPEVQDFDVFVLLGGNTKVVMERPELRQRLVDLAAAGTVMTSMFTGSLIYAKAGLLDHNLRRHTIRRSISANA
jgi:transcriptional regulator GlxA family with amidase domain